MYFGKLTKRKGLIYDIKKKENKMRKKQTGRDEYVQMIIKSMKSVWWAKKFMVERIC